ncbi:serine/threonine protein kinase [Chaetoceros tenuissimus]|uniref:Serine/threonine protein kinase n=1 Tax=Chaetoceros tenuissimus TaxID=426638 RepID=A0AAD3D1E1_9STRA|nr:serine/threonine protein kinase [Chaetoceros tenuissimus]
MKKYKLICKKGEGTFSEVVCGENIENGQQYAIKCMKSSFGSLDEVNNLREVEALRRLTPHPHIVNLEEVLFDAPSGRLAMVFELLDANLYDLISGRRDHLDADLVNSLGYQMFKGIEHMHHKGIFHRDIKPENILVDKSRKHLKIADMGSSRSVTSKPPFTEYIATRWYRSPECLLTDGHYGPEMDIWGAGCVLFEIIALFPLFPGSDEVDQVNRIHKVVGTPSDDIIARLKAKGSAKINYKFSNMKGIGIKHFIPHASSECVDLLNQTMIYDHTKRIVALDAMGHSYFSKYHGVSATSEKKTSMATKTSNLISSFNLFRGAKVQDEEANHEIPVVSTHGPTKETSTKTVHTTIGLKKSPDPPGTKASTVLRKQYGLTKDPSKDIKKTLSNESSKSGKSDRGGMKTKPKTKTIYGYGASNTQRTRIRNATRVEDKVKNLKNAKSHTSRPVVKQTKTSMVRTKPTRTTDKKATTSTSKPSNISSLTNQNRLRRARQSNNPTTTKAPATTKTSKPQLTQSKSSKKYANIKSSGYGRTSYHPKPLHGRLSHPAKDPANISAGTQMTASSSLPPNEKSSGTLQRKKLSLAAKTTRRTYDRRTDRNEKSGIALPPIRT